LYNIEEIKNQILCGDAYDVLPQLPDKSVRLVITSPPYWQTRDYKLGSGELGHEKSVDHYITNLTNIFWKLQRVLTDDGSLWVVISDKIDGDMVGVPERFVLEMQKDGWIRRRTIIWHKPSCKPQSVKNAFTVDFEYFYWFSKSKNPYFKTQYEPLSPITIKEAQEFYKGQATKDYESHKAENPSDIKRRINKKFAPIGGTKHSAVFDNMSGESYEPDITNGRIKRCVWHINPNRLRSNWHYSVFPPELVKTPILACSDEGDIVLDPFMGSGSTGIAAMKENRYYVGIERNPQDVEKAKARILMSGAALVKTHK